MKSIIRTSTALLIMILLFSCVKDQHGLTGTYYKGVKLDNSGRITTAGLEKAFERVDPNIDFWDETANYSWSPIKDHGDNYTVVWNGYIKIDKDGEYGFGTISDDGSEVWIDDKLVVDNAQYQWYDWEDNHLHLTPGMHKISVKFFEGSEFDGIKFFWLTPGKGKSVIPYQGTDFSDVPPVYDKGTNWEIVPSSVLFVRN